MMRGSAEFGVDNTARTARIVEKYMLRFESSRGKEF